ncbi:zinc finger, CCHC-type containing protein [Tanacetum coccineum]
MNGCIQIGTLDGANVEIRQEVREENFFLFGAEADEIVGLRKQRSEDKFREIDGGVGGGGENCGGGWEMDGGVEEVDDFSLEAIEDEDVSLIDGVFEGGFGTLAEETSLIKLRVAFYAINARRLPLALLVYTLVRPPMTTSVVNNSVFRGFFEKHKLTGPKFIDWYRQLRIVLSVEDKLDYLEQRIPPTPVPAQAGQQKSDEIWKTLVLMRVKNSVCSTSRAGPSSDCERLSLLQTGRRAVWRKIPESPWGSPVPIGDRDGDVNRFPDGDGDGDGDEAEKRGWGW